MSTLDRYQYGYDGNSNRLYKANVVGTPIVSGGLDELYSYDNLNRLIVMQRGTLNGTNTGITGTPSREMDYTLDPTGNWSSYLTKTSGTTDLNQTRTANKVNEITAIGGTPGWATPPAYDAAGNMTTMPQPETPGSAFTTTYDAWNRMTSISDSGGTVASYQYDGMNRRTVKTTTATSETRHFYYKAWQDIEERVGSSTSADQQYVWGIRYVDELVCRDDPTNGRLYAMQDANFNLTSICDTSATVKERYYYDPYGNRSIMDGSWSSIGTSAYNWVIGHQGLMIDQESGLIYNRNRMLHPELGRFGRRDPSGYEDGPNLYEYCNSAPNEWTDAYGLMVAISPYASFGMDGYLCAGTCSCTGIPGLSSSGTPHWLYVLELATLIVEIQTVMEASANAAAIVSCAGCTPTTVKNQPAQQTAITQKLMRAAYGPTVNCNCT